MQNDRLDLMNLDYLLKLKDYQEAVYAHSDYNKSHGYRKILGWLLSLALLIFCFWFFQQWTIVFKNSNFLQIFSFLTPMFVLAILVNPLTKLQQSFSYYLIQSLSFVSISIGLISLFISSDRFSAFYPILIGILTNPYVKKFQLSRVYNSQPSLREPVNLKITEEGLKLQGASYESKLQWQVYTKFLEAKNVFLLYQSNNCFNIIPKRAFLNVEQIEEFRSLTTTYISRV